MGFEIVCKWFNHSSPAVTIWKLHTSQIKQLLAGISKQIKLQGFLREGDFPNHGSFFGYPRWYMDRCRVTIILLVYLYWEADIDIDGQYGITVFKSFSNWDADQASHTSLISLKYCLIVRCP